MTSTSDVPNGTQFGVLLDKTNFYAEAGGQIFVTGRLIIDDVAKLMSAMCSHMKPTCYTLAI